MSDVADDLQRAIAGVLKTHGYGLLSRLVFVVELVDEEDGALGLMRGSCPADTPIWSELGFHQYAVTDIQATVAANRAADSEEDE